MVLAATKPVPTAGTLLLRGAIADGKTPDSGADTCRLFRLFSKRAFRRNRQENKQMVRKSLVLVPD